MGGPRTMRTGRAASVLLLAALLLSPVAVATPYMIDGGPPLAAGSSGPGSRDAGQGGAHAGDPFQGHTSKPFGGDPAGHVFERHGSGMGDGIEGGMQGLVTLLVEMNGLSAPAVDVLSPADLVVDRAAAFTELSSAMQRTVGREGALGMDEASITAGLAPSPSGIEGPDSQRFSPAAAVRVRLTLGEAPPRRNGQSRRLGQISQVSGVSRIDEPGSAP